MKEHLNVRKADLVEVLKILETLVVSLDRIGSHHHECDRRTYERLISEFIEDWAVAPKLSAARRILSEYFDATPDDHGLEELERAIHDTPCWDLDRRRPPEKTRVT